MKLLQTDRLMIRQLTLEDAGFILELVNEPEWLRYIGDKNVRSIEEAEDYIKTGPMQMIEQYGFALFLTMLASDHTPIGLCGLLKRDTLDDVDLGFAFLQKYHGQGYAREAANAVIDFARSSLDMTRVVAIVQADNKSSVSLLKHLGFKFEKLLNAKEDSEDLHLYALNLES